MYSYTTESNTQNDIRLVGRSGQTRGTAGRVEVLYNNRWHTVSTSTPPTSYFDFSSVPPNRAVAGVACRQLGYPDLIYWGTVGDLR